MPVGTRSNTRRTSTSSFISGPPRDQERSPARPPPQHSQEDEEEQTPNSGSPHIRFSPSTTKTSATGLSLHVQKSLLQDIEESGGLVVACVRNLCNRRRQHLRRSRIGETQTSPEQGNQVEESRRDQVLQTFGQLRCPTEILLYTTCTSTEPTAVK